MINLLVLKSTNPEKVVEILSILGLTFEIKPHQEISVHYTAQHGEIVIEIYKTYKQFDNNNFMLGFLVTDLTATKAQLVNLGCQTTRDNRDTDGSIVVQDFEGRKYSLKSWRTERA